MSGQVSVPNPLTLVVVHFSGIWPQLRRHVTKGTGTPVARHVIINVVPGSRVIIGGGGEITAGAARKAIMLIKKIINQMNLIYSSRLHLKNHHNQLVNRIGMIWGYTVGFGIGIRRTDMVHCLVMLHNFPHPSCPCLE